MQQTYYRSGGIFLVTNPQTTQSKQQNEVESLTLLPANTLPPSKNHSLKEFSKEASIYFLERHLMHSRKELDAINHLVIYLHGELQLLQHEGNGKFKLIEKHSTPANNDPYLLLKITCHFSITLYEIMEQVIQGKILFRELPHEVERLHKQMEPLKKDYPEYFTEVKPTLNLILSCLSALNDCKTIKTLKSYQEHYLEVLRPNLEKYAAQATSLQLVGLHQISTRWMTENHLDLGTTYIIIVGARGPKKDLIEHQYFNALRAHYGVEEKNTPTGGIIYSEMLPQQMNNVTVDMLVDDLARDVHNMQIGLGMLQDRQAMFKDILGKFAPPILKKLHPQPQSKCPMHLKSLDNLYKFFPPLKEERNNRMEEQEHLLIIK